MICFMCNAKRDIETNRYCKDGFASCSLEETAKKLIDKKLLKRWH